MTQDANFRLTGKQMRLVAEGLRNAFVDYNDLARPVKNLSATSRTPPRGAG